MQFAAPSEQQSVTTPTQTSDGNAKATNGSGKVLHRVIALTAASQSDNLSGKPTSKSSPPHLPEKLRFSAFEKFEGELQGLGKDVAKYS